LGFCEAETVDPDFVAKPERAHCFRDGHPQVFDLGHETGIQLPRLATAE